MPDERNEQPILQVENLVKEFVVKRNLLGTPELKLRAIDNISFSLNRGETFGIVGESGCGKSTLGRTILRLEEPTSGRILFNGIDLTALKKEELRQIRRKIQIIFQDPYASLNPRSTVRELIRAPLDAYEIGTPEERSRRVEEMMQLVGLDPDYLCRYPHEFSGGQRQRIVIARALILQPEFVICDEPVSALDVSVRSQVLNLLKDLQKKLNLTCIFISHDLSVVKYVSNRIAVMYLGHIAELAEKNELYDNPLHPYTQALLSAIPVPDVDHVRVLRPLQGDVPSPIDPPSGCVFHTRCPFAKDVCSEKKPTLVCTDPSTGHLCACHFPHLPSNYSDFI